MKGERRSDGWERESEEDNGSVNGERYGHKVRQWIRQCNGDARRTMANSCYT